MCGKRWHVPSTSATPWDPLDESQLSPAQLFVMGRHRDAYDMLHALDWRGDAEFLNAHERAACPWCGSPAIARKGRDRRGVRRWACRRCRRTFTPATGTIFEDRKLPVSAWVEFWLDMMSFESIAGLARSERRSPTTPPYWLQKTFMVLDGVQDGVVLSGRVQIDEVMYPVPASEAEMGRNGRKPGFSRNQTCVAIACEETVTPERGRSVFRVLGRGKPSAERAKAAYCPHIEEGSELVHDRENSHNAVVRELRLSSETHDSRAIKRLPDDENPLRRVNRLCFLLRTFLDGHNGFDRSNFGGWLDLFHVMMNPPHDRLEKAAWLLERAMACPVRLRYRDHYRQMPSLEDR